MNLKLTELLNLPGCPVEFYGDRKRLERSPPGVSIDTRTLAPGELYFALRGERLDGHDFVAEARSKGAVAAVVEKRWYERQDAESQAAGPLFVVADTLEALQAAAQYYRSKFALPVLALTGTNGKTTTKEMIAAVLRELGPVCKTEGNLNNHIGLPLTLFRLREAHRVAVLEMGMNHFGEIARLCEIARPDFGLITNIGHGHVEFLGGLEGVAKAKLELFEALPPDGLGFVNLDDPILAQRAPQVGPARKRTYGFAEGAEVHAERVPPDASGFPGMRVQGRLIRLNLLGSHNLSNALAAIAVGLEFGVSLADMAHALAQVHVPDKRMQVSRQDDILVLNDAYNANPESTQAALQILNEVPCSGKRVFVFGDMLELGDYAPEAHAEIGRSLPRFGVDVFLAYGPQAATAVAAALEAAPRMHAKHFENKTELTKELSDLLQKGDVLLVKGSRGMKMEEILDELFSGT